MQKKPTSAYVHIPFCTQICYYCDFSKVFIKNQPVDSYLEHLLEEFRSYDIQKLRTLYIGGGTPTALSAPQLEVLLDGLTKNLDLSVLEELTIEANPGDLNADKIAVLKNSAVNRVSLGVQTFDDKMLKKIGRSHLEKDIYENIDRLKLAGFDNISIDLIYALPGQTMDQVKENVAKAISLDIPHMSLYSLILENHTVFMNRMRRGKLPLPKEELEAEMFEYIIAELERAGFEHYEISNFSKPGFESRHNLMYWDNAEYYGIGAGASGYVDGVRYKNHGPIRHYLSAVEAGDARITEERLSQKEQMEEEMFLGLRKKSGVSMARFEEKFGRSFDGLYGEILFWSRTMGLTYQMKMKIPFDMADMNGHIKLPDVILLSLQVSGMQSIELGVSDKDMLERYNLVWIITDYAIDVVRLPRFAEEITIETEALTYNRLFCYRRFTIYDEAGQEIIRMVATFVLMDRDSRKVHAVEPEIVAPYQSEFDKKLIRGPKYANLENPFSKDYHVRFYDLDMNGHVNNSKYLDWIFEVMGADFLTKYIPKKINLRYVKEVRPGGMIASAYELKGLESKHEIISDGEINAQAMITWQEIEGN